jgi:surfactin synthase thioesterase subunit
LTKLVLERNAQAREKLVVIGHSLGGIYARELVLLRYEISRNPCLASLFIFRVG